jgi:putative toxin-antitoxin system antitoxin component (TIGR02293 family)
MPAALQSNKSRASVATSAYAGVEKILGTHLGVDGPIQLHEHIVRGLPQQSMVQLIDRLIIIDCDSGLRAVGTSRSTWHRIKASRTPKATLDSDRSSRVWNLAEVLATAEELLGSKEEAERWLSSPAIGLDSHKPIDLMASPQGAELVKTLLARMAHGVYA